MKAGTYILFITISVALIFSLQYGGFNLYGQSASNGHIIVKGHGPALSNVVYSLNWAGYVAASSFSSPSATVSSVSGSWIVQTANPTKKSTYSAQWIGIGGYFSNDNSLIQTGTSSDYSNGASYYAWYELLPASETQITNLIIRPGDNISASIKEIKSFGSVQEWNITIKDVTSKETFSKLVNYSSSMLSAEWIEERPAFCTAVMCRLTTLSDFGTAYYGMDYTNVPFTNYATINSTSGYIGDFNNQDIVMVNNNGAVIASPSSLNTNGSSFTVQESSSSSPHGGKNK
ncbi:G1 family endopeptidase [Candidatus Parvarchaeota archaeon]|nr:G1 family endopeptidase [Candidatus Parvarchaeota archaeon]